MRPATILRIHSIISAALDLAVRYEWTDRNAAKNARPPHPRKREPDPPSPEQAARLLNLVWAEDEEFGLYLWTAFTTGARRGEVTGLRENRFDFTHQQIRASANYIVKQGTRIEKPPKTGDGRLLSLDLLTCELFRERFQRRSAEAAQLRRGHAGRRLRVLPWPYGPHAMEPRHHDTPIPPVCPQNRHYQLAEGTAALLRYPAPHGRHRSEYRRRSPRPRRRLDHLEVLRPIHPGPPTSTPQRLSRPSSTASARGKDSGICTARRHLATTSARHRLGEGWLHRGHQGLGAANLGAGDSAHCTATARLNRTGRHLTSGKPHRVRAEPPVTACSEECWRRSCDLPGLRHGRVRPDPRGASRGSAWLPADDSVSPWSSSPSPGLFPAT